MPKIVDHEKQRLIVAEAALRIIRRSGLEEATVRNIAAEAGLSPGSMRHYFSTQAELFIFCMHLFLQKIQERIELFDFNNPDLVNLKHLLLEFLPLDEERKMEMEVWFSFNAKTLTMPELKELSNAMYEGLHRASSFVVNTLREHNLMKRDLDVDVETETLYALVDGLALHHLMQPERLTAERIEFIIDQHLQKLCEHGNGLDPQ